jgi:hypothetical protein
MNPRAKTLSQLAKLFQKMKPVTVIAKNLFPLVASGGDVVAPAGPFDA